MFTTMPRYNKNCFFRRYFAFVGVLLLTTTATASAQEIVWPNTFNGQPEFSFSKKEVNDEQNKLAVGRGKLADTDPVAALSTLIKRSIADPFANQQHCGQENDLRR